MVRALTWVDDPPTLRLIDQTALPGTERYLDIRTVDSLVAAIQSLAVRGAPALGACGGYGIVVAMHQAKAEGWSSEQLTAEIDRIRDARPTAVNLAWGVDRVRPLVPEGVDAVLTEAQGLAREDEEANRTLSKLGADWILARTGKDRLRVVTHCNTGALATTGWGSAYGIIHELHQRGKIELVYADETRPLLQGARLTAFELQSDGINYVIEADGAASSTILRGLADVVIYGADRIVANADTANKIGSVSLALAAHRAGIPCVVAAPFSTVDLEVASGDDIVIEQRPESEVLALAGVPVAPAGARGFNPAFDVTPADLISAVVTENGIVEPAVDGDPRIMARLMPR